MNVMDAECAAEAHSRHLRALVESLASEERGLFSPLSGAAKRPVVRRLHTDGARAAQPTEQLAQVDCVHLPARCCMISNFMTPQYLNQDGPPH